MEMIKPFKPQKECEDEIRQARCIDVLRREKILHLGLFHAHEKHDSKAKEYPYVVPQTYGFDFKDEIPVIYMHLGDHSNPILKALKKNNKVYFSVEADVQVMPFRSNPCLSTVRYFGVEGRGKIELLHYDESIKEDFKYAMNVIMRQMTGEFGNNKYLVWDYNLELLKQLVILKLSIESYKPTEHAYDYQPSLHGKQSSKHKSK